MLFLPSSLGAVITLREQMVLKLLLSRLENHFAHSGITGESICQEDTPSKSRWVTEAGSSYSASWNSVSTLVAVALHHSGGASRQSVPGGSPVKPPHLLPSQSWLVLVHWFAQLGPAQILRNRTPSLSERQNHLRNVSLQLWDSTSEVLMQGVCGRVPREV